MDHPTSDPSSPAGPPHRAVRRVVVVLAWIKTILIVLLAFAVAIGGGGSDPAGQAYLYAGFVLGGLYWLALILPALLLVRSARGGLVGLALALLILPDVVLVLAAATL